MRSVRTTLAYVAAAIVAAFGLLALLNPLVAVRVLGLEVMEPRGLSEVRATYGAFLLVLGGAMAWAVRMRPRGTPWVRLIGIVFLGASLGRVASVVLDGVFTPFNLAVLAVTAFVAVAALLASFQRRPTAPAASSGRERARTGRRLFGGGRRASGAEASSGPQDDA